MTQQPYGSPPPYPPQQPPYAQQPFGAVPLYPAPVASATDPGLNQPWYGIGFVDALTRPYKKYADFSGRASRGEYWWFYLAIVAVGVIIVILAGIGGGGGFTTFMMVVFYVVYLGSIIPMLALGVRRLHDTNKSGALLLLGLIPLVGTIIVIVLLATEAYRGPTVYENPPVGAQPVGYPAAPTAYPAAAAPYPAAPAAYPAAQPPAYPGAPTYTPQPQPPMP